MEVTFDTSVLAGPDLCRVFVTHYQVMDTATDQYSDLERFGRIVIPLFAGKTIFPDAATRAEGTLPGYIMSVLLRHQFNPTHDYIALNGDVLVQAVAISAVASRFPAFTTLRFDKRQSRYWPFRIAV